MRTVTFSHDSDPDFSWLKQDHLNPTSKDYSPVYRTRADMKAGRDPMDGDWYRDPANHVALCMLVRSGERIIDSLGNIDFIADEDNWTTGTFAFVNDIPKRCRYQRSLAREAGLRYRPRRKYAPR